MLQLGSPRKPIRIADLVLSTLRGAKEPKRVLGGFAYANVAGVSAVGISKDGEDWRRQAETRWLVGIDQGRTEPASLEALLSLTDSELRMFVPDGRLDRSALLSPPRFHAKVVFVEAGDPVEPKLIWLASANMTGAALGGASKNYEAGLAMTPEDGLNDDHASLFLGWWHRAWESGIIVTPRRIAQYADLRGEFLRRNPGVLESIDQPVPGILRAASSLWIEAGAMSGGARNQIEFSRELAWFFGKPARKKRQVDISAEGQEIRGRPLTPKRTTFGVDIWRLGLPTGYDYAGKVVFLKRLISASGKNPRFELLIEDRGSATAKKWFDLASRLGTVGATHGTQERRARDYGCY